MGQCVIDDTHGAHKHNMRPLSRHQEFTNCSSGLRVKDSSLNIHIIMLPKELAVLYSYDKSCVHAKHIVIKIKLML
jgi:hypothetical protein